jgi:predicted O-methyltransferase YrrM
MRDGVKRWVRKSALGEAAIEGIQFVQAKYKYKFRLSSPPGHYYSPIPSAADLERVYAHGPRPDHAPEISLQETAQLELLKELGSFSEDFMAEASGAGTRFNSRNDMFNGDDALVLYSMIRHLRPARIVEVGSGHSSALMLDVNDNNFNNQIALTFIEPFPDRLLSILRPEDHSATTILTRPVQDVDMAVFGRLEAGDFLFIDSSHVSKTGSDLNFLLFEVLPSLRPGVIIHFHDIYWPFENPSEWAYQGRAWNENYMLRAFLAYNRRFEIMLFDHWLATTQAAKAKTLVSGWSNNGTGSLWLRRVD